jgi:transcriptional regulator with XRE-family HTH domain
VIGEALKMFRTIHGYKAKELAGQLEVSPSYLSEIENGKKSPSYELLEKYANVFDVKLSTLIIFTEDYSKNKHTGKAQNGVRKMLFNFMKRLDEEVANDEESE